MVTLVIVSSRVNWSTISGPVFPLIVTLVSVNFISDSMAPPCNPALLPLSVRMPATTRLAGDDLKTFEAERDRIERQLLEGRQDLVAHAVCRADGC